MVAIRQTAIAGDTLTPKQEKFAQLVVEYSNYTQAYREAYNTENQAPSTVWAHAWQLATQHDLVKTRIAELNDQKKIDITPEYISQRMTRTYEAATGDKQHSAAVKAMDLAAKVAGLYETGTHITTTIQQIAPSFAGLSVDELRTMLAEAEGDAPKAIEGEVREVNE